MRQFLRRLFVPVPFSYSWRSLWARRLTTSLTLGGLALVVFVFAGVLMLAQGLEATLVDTGSRDNAIVLRRSAGSELVSQIDRGSASILETQPEVAAARDGRPLLSREVLVVINLYKKTTNGMSNVSVRGVSPQAFELRPGFHIVQGKPFQFGTHEMWARTSRTGSAASRSAQSWGLAGTGGPWSGSPMPAARASTPRSGGMPIS